MEWVSQLISVENFEDQWRKVSGPYGAGPVISLLMKSMKHYSCEFSFEMLKQAVRG